ncbi:MAG: hypothetical protein J0L86_16865 [Flavobacteriales bacterium]|nr:hypothetical protein [Flavobacteriales bacterium]
MKNIIYFFTVFLFLSCNDKTNKDSEGKVKTQVVEEKHLDEGLKKLLIEYQNEYPIPIKKRKRNYVYSAFFLKHNNDTLLLLSRTYGILKLYKGYGLYQDSELKPTFIYDNDHFGDKFIFKKINKNNGDFYEGYSSKIYDGHPPKYWYRINNKSFNLIKIDTVWDRWD